MSRFFLFFRKTFWALLISLTGHCTSESTQTQPCFAKHPQYQGLRKLWQRYKAIGKDIKLPLSCIGKPLKKKYTATEKTLIQRLFQLGFLSSEKEETSYPELIQALKKFQLSCNLHPHGKMDRKTLRYLNRSLKNWRHHIWQNLKRWSNTLSSEPRYVVINIPEGLLYLFQDHQPIFTSKVIVGKYDSPTVPFQNHIKSLLTHPTWYVPENLAQKLKENVGSRGYALSRDGALIQKPCAHNPLGPIKFSFLEPAKHSIIMHGTNKPHLFRKKQRFFSLGCIRIHRYKELAKLLLAPEQWTDFEGSLENNKSCAFSLPSPMPVSAAYITLWIEPDGCFKLIDDFYDEDDEDDEEEELTFPRGSAALGEAE